jgi:hypothetical protein
MEGEALKLGKERVRHCLIDPLAARGMVRASGLTVAQHDAQMDGLAARLAYMTEENLIALSEVVEGNGAGKHRNRWPSEMMILQWAKRLQPPPPSDSHLVTTYLRSNAGRRARAEGWLVELYQYLKKFGRPPNDYAIRELKIEADTAMRRRARVEEAARFGGLDPEDGRWLEWWMGVEARATAIMDMQDGAAA